jgi:A/G-specific adenine glycosylase
LRKIAKLLLDWYVTNARKLPWRDRSDPYAIWVSEIMLQQTRVDTVIPYYEKWMKKFPSVSDLALSEESDVLAVWEGLGYYSRARNLHRASQKIMLEYNGKLPCSLEELIKLPGIGRYTAGAIASIAFKLDVTTLDGNITRVISRLFDIQEHAESPQGKNELWGYLDAELPKGFAGDFNQALMDLGATICTPKAPDCEQCPLRNICVAKAKDIQTERPIIKTKPVQPIYTYVCAIIQNKENFLLTQNPPSGLLGGLWDFPNTRILSEKNDLEIEMTVFLYENFGKNVRVSSKQIVIKHAYTHFRLILHVYKCSWISKKTDLPGKYFWTPRNELLNYPMGKVARQISRILIGDE